MQKRIPIKNHHHEIHLIARRSMYGFIGIFFLLILLIIRLAYLQIYKHDVYTTLATKNWLDLVPVEPSRGLIYDRRGILLAENIPVFSLDVIPSKVPNMTKTITLLKKIVLLTDNDISQFQKQRGQHRSFDEIPLKLRLTEDEVARVVENQHRFTGVLVKARLLRHYPFGESFSHVLGYVGRINSKELNEIDQVNYSASHYIGKLGIEKYYEEELHGKVGYEEVENDASGKAIRVINKIKGQPGKNIYLTIDSDLQFAAENALSNRGAVVAIQPATGQVLAIVSKPSYDPNLFVIGISQKDYRDLQDSHDRPLYNRALRGLYAPASTVKPYYALQGLNTGTIRPEDSIYDPGWFELPNYSRPYHDSSRYGHGRVNLTKALTVSCDVYFYQVALKLGIKRMDDILTQFGFGAHTGIDLDDELSGTVASPEWKYKMRGIRWYEGDTVLSGIGQGFMQVTPMQLAVAVSTLANRGQRFVPYLLLGEQTPGKAYVDQQPISLEPITLQHNKYWDVIIDAMQDVVTSEQGTARRFGHADYTYTIAAKTGTAQVASRRNPDEMDKQESMPEKLRDHHLFIAFAPVDKPKIALAIVTENSNTAVETARAIFDYYLGHKENVNRQVENNTEKTSAR